MGWGKMKDVKKIKGLNWAFGKIVRWKKIIRYIRTLILAQNQQLSVALPMP